MSEQQRSGGGALPGLVKGLAVTAKALVTPAHTAEYPDVPPSLPPRSRGVIALLEENCTVCMLCARECPDWCIYIDSHKETLPATTEGGRERQRNVLDRFDIDFSLCMYCSICIEVCPFDALHWSPEFEYSELDIRDLLHGRDRLAQWMPTVPPPPAADPGAAEPKEVAAAQRPARPARPARSAGTGASAAEAPARPARDRPAGERPVRERPVRERPAGERPARTPRTGASAAGSPAPPAGEQPAPQHPTADGAAPEGPPPEQPAPEQPTSEGPAPERPDAP